jgi:branched-subunit amino acid ABC-type transport system permease component
MQRSVAGRRIRAVASNPGLCEWLGINVAHITLYSVGIASALSALSGALAAFDSNLTPTMGFRLLLNGLIVAIAAGVGNTFTLIGAAMALSLVQHLTALYVHSRWIDVVGAAALLILLCIRPRGLGGWRVRQTQV